MVVGVFRSGLRARGVALGAALVTLAGCPSNGSSTATPSASATASASASATATASATAAPSASATASASAAPTASATATATAAPAVLTLRVINASTVPLRILTNDDTNELMHTRMIYERRPPEARTDGVLVKFFPVGQMPLCTDRVGAGYGGLGQPEPRTLAPNEAIEFPWDGQQRREVNQPDRGVCQQLGAPDPGRYRFEFDQPYNAPQCTRPTITLPLAPDAPRVVEIRCQPRRASAEPREE